MTILSAGPFSPEYVAQLSDSELEEELTLAALTTAREQHYELLLKERLRRRQRPSTLDPRTT